VLSRSLPGGNRYVVRPQGGTNFSADAAGGDGAEVTASLAVSAGEVLGVDVGGAGQGGTLFTAGGVNGGGSSVTVLG
jgi:hypothetical protein